MSGKKSKYNFTYMFIRYNDFVLLIRKKNWKVNNKRSLSDFGLRIFLKVGVSHINHHRFVISLLANLERCSLVKNLHLKTTTKLASCIRCKRVCG